MCQVGEQTLKKTCSVACTEQDGGFIIWYNSGKWESPVVLRCLLENGVIISLPIENKRSTNTLGMLTSEQKLRNLMSLTPDTRS